MAITEKDIKLLWGRAASRCSMCQVEVTMDDSDGAGKTLGEMCHIVGAKPTSARHDSPLTGEQRDAYSNLLLLCRNHHAEIDADPGEYPIEVLHALKSDHEDWVRESLAETDDPDDLAYAHLVDVVCDYLPLHMWPDFVSDAVREIVWDRVLLEAGPNLHALRQRFIWGGKCPEFEEAARRMLDAFCDLIRNYEQNIQQHGDHAFKRASQPQIPKELVEVWAECHWLLLERFVLRLNEFSEAVRRHLNPLFFRVQGHFLIVDDLGYQGGTARIFVPEEEAVRKHFEATLALPGYGEYAKIQPLPTEF